MPFDFSRVFKTPQELEVMRYVNRVSSEAHKEVNSLFLPQPELLKLFVMFIFIFFLAVILMLH